MRTHQILAQLGIASIGFAFQFPSWVPFVGGRETGQTTFSLPPPDFPNKIAIIGAGAGGSSAAFWLSKAKERFGLDFEVDVFEKSDYIGGRSTAVYPYDDPELEPMELGASIFVKVNKNLWRATDEFGLERYDFDDDDDALGIWDGTQFLFETGGSKWFYESWWDTLKVLWRYGYKAPMKTRSIVSNIIDRYLNLYSHEFGVPFKNMSELVDTFDWKHVVAQTTQEYFDLQGVDRKWTREMVEAATRVNYGQNADAIHALEGVCSLAATGASSVKGGNFQIFEEFIKRSKANILLNTTVTSISKDKSTNLWTVQSMNASSVFVESRTYRAVILAAPYHSTSIALSSSNPLPVIPPQPYVHLHVTLLATPSLNANPLYFGLDENAKTPQMILTTYEGVRNGGVEPEFNSLSYHGRVARKDGQEREVEEGLVKIFSKERVEDAWLKTMFGEVGWVYRKEWDAYPVLPPTTRFPPIKLDKGFYYVNAFEPFISTMETETISSRNAVQLLLQDIYNAGLCKASGDAEAANTTTTKEDFVYGWDC